MNHVSNFEIFYFVLILHLILGKVTKFLALLEIVNAGSGTNYHFLPLLSRANAVDEG